MERQNRTKLPFYHLFVEKKKKMKRILFKTKSYCKLFEAMRISKIDPHYSWKLGNLFTKYVS